MEIKYILLIVILHFIADFIFQDEEWATKKSTSNEDLLSHTLVYSLIMFGGLFVIGVFETKTGVKIWSVLDILKFTVVTFIFHTITDYLTSRVVKQKFDNEEYGSRIPNLGAFSIIGFDQLLHFIQLFLCFDYFIFTM
jgi:hypothetical protein